MITLLALLAFAGANGTALASVQETYARHCAACHHAERWGLTGPPLLPEYFGPKKQAEIAAIISEGLPATNMPAFRGTLSDNEIREVAAFIRTRAAVPVWTASEMLSTRTMAESADPANEPSWDMEDFFMVVEGGTGKVHFMDGRSFNVLDSVKAGAIHGGPKFDSRLRWAYMVSRDGWVVKYDLLGLREAGRIRAAVSGRNIAISADSRHIAVASLLPEALVVLDAESLEPVRSFSLGAVSSVYSLRGSARFIAAFKDRPELVLIGQDGFQTESISVDQPLTDFFIAPGERYLVGTSREGRSISVVDLKEGRLVKSIESKVKMPHLASAAVWSANGAVYAAFPHIGEAAVSVLELYSWEVKKTVRTRGPGFFARAHEYAPHVWVDTGTDTIQLIDKKTLEVAAELTPEPGKKAMHVEFTKEGSFALVSVSEKDGAVVVYDARSLKPVKSLPFNRPVGKYNATNKKY